VILQVYLYPSILRRKGAAVIALVSALECYNRYWRYEAEYCSAMICLKATEVVYFYR